MTPTVTPFFHKDSCTWTYLVRDPTSPTAIVIDPVLDFDAASGRGSSRPMPTPTTSVPALG